jgi:large subunit ribosomal protein L6
MSRIGKQPITIPPKVKVEIKGTRVNVEGPKGKLSLELPPRTAVKIEGGNVIVSRDNDEAKSKAMHGVGFKAAVQGKSVVLNLGYSHPINYPIPDQIKVTVDENTKLTVEGPDKMMVGKVAAEIRSFYPPEPYKGKGVKYSDEKIVRKEGKTVQ